MENNSQSKLSIQIHLIGKMITRFMDKWILHKTERWIFFYFILTLFFLRMVWVQGYYAIAYILGFTILQNIILYLTPQEIPTIDEEDDDEIFDIPSTININQNDESKPVIRKLNEYHLWYIKKEKIDYFYIYCFFNDFF